MKLRTEVFFGGTAKLYLWVTGLPNPPDQPVMTFRIGGRNPDQQIARNYIDTTAGAQYWYAYAIAREETAGRVRENCASRFYNQFYNEFQGGAVGDAANSMDTVAWAKAWPLYNLDRAYNKATGYSQNGPGGYGIFQLTWGPKHPNDPQGTGANAFVPRRTLWNWRDNISAALSELRGKFAASQSLHDGLESAYPEWGAIPAHPDGALSGLEAMVVTAYNGLSTEWPRTTREVNGEHPRSPWQAETVSGNKKWQFHENSQNYAHKVSGYINNAMP